MPHLVEDAWINSQMMTHDLSELEDCSIAVDATYFLSQTLDGTQAHEPLLPALGGLTGIQIHINESLNQWKANRIVPFFIFDGQSLKGQEDIALSRAREANEKTNEAWSLYSQSEADQAVAAFGADPGIPTPAGGFSRTGAAAAMLIPLLGAFRVQNLFPLLQGILKSRNLHFLVAPYNACSQLAYFELIDSEQCAGVMGPQELLPYPIKGSIIRSFDWEAKKVTSISKFKIMRELGVSESMLTDALLMTGTSFLAPFPPLQDRSIYQNPFTIVDAVNILRTSDKGVANACASFNDILQAQDPDWLDKYRKARLAVHHFIYIAETGDVQVNDYDHLTQDNHEYLGLQLPAELFHYLNSGLIGARILNCITHSQVLVQPTLDGAASDEYKKLVTSQIIPIKEQALGLIVPRVHRGIAHKNVTMRTWFDPKFSYTLNHSSLQPPPSQKVGSWDVKEKDIREYYPADLAGPVALEVLALVNPEFAAKTIAKEKIITGIDSTEMVTSLAIWRWLHLRGYADDSHQLTTWGNALGTTYLAIQDAMEGRPEVPGLDEAILLAFELIKFGLLNGRPRETFAGFPRKGSDDEKATLALISQCATLLKLRHQVFGYTGPLNRDLLAFRSLSTTVRESDRDLIEAIVASMFMFGQCKRERDDHFEISQRLPFSSEPDIGLGIAVRTFFDEDEISHSKEARAARLEEFPKTFVPFAEDLVEDFRVCADFVGAIGKGVQTLDDKALIVTDKAAWAKAQEYLDARPF